MDKLTWFKFSPSDWMMGKISKLPLKVQGEYIRFICTYWNKKCEMSIDDAKLEFSDASWNKLQQYNLIKVNDNAVCIEFLDEQMLDINLLSIKRSQAGKRSAEIRSKKNTSLTSVKQNPTEKKRKEKKIDIYREFEHLKISNIEYSKLLTIYSKEKIDECLDNIENYKNNKNYKSLYLTAKSWLQRMPQNDEQDNLVNNVMKQINDK